MAVTPAPSSGWKDYSGLLGNLMAQGQPIPGVSQQGNTLLSALQQMNTGAPAGGLGASPQGVPSRAPLTLEGPGGTPGLGGPATGGGGAFGQPSVPSLASLGLGTQGMFGSALGLGQFGTPSPGLAASLGITGNLGAGINTGNQGLNTAVNTALGKGLGAFGVPTGINALSLIGLLTHAAPLGIAGGALGALGAPLGLVSIAHSLAQLSPHSTFNLAQNVAQGLAAPVGSPDHSFAVSALAEAQAAAAAAATGQSFSFTSPEAAALAAEMGVQGIAASSTAKGGFVIGQQSNVGANVAPPANPAVAAAIAAALSNLGSFFGFGSPSSSGIDAAVSAGLADAAAAAASEGTDVGSSIGVGGGGPSGGGSSDSGSGAPDSSGDASDAE